MIYRARTENTEMFIAMYETEEPTKYLVVPQTPPLRINIEKAAPEFTGIISEAWEQWQSSKREYKVRKEDEQAIKQELLGEVPFMLSDIETELEKGIDCTFLKDRLKLECTGCGWDYNKPIGPTHLACCPDNRYQWTLLPLEDREEECVKHVAGVGRVYMCATSCAQLPNCKIKNMSNLSLEDKKENEAEIWQEAFDIIYDTNILWTKMEEQLKSKFNISRKPTIQEPE